MVSIYVLLLTCLFLQNKSSSHRLTVFFRHKYFDKELFSLLKYNTSCYDNSWKYNFKRHRASSIQSNFASFLVQDNVDAAIICLATCDFITKVAKELPFHKRYLLSIHPENYSHNHDFKVQGSNNYRRKRNLLAGGINKKNEIKYHPSILSEEINKKGILGKGIKIAVFDTGMDKLHPYFKNVVEITDWTDDGTTDDKIGHGTFNAGVMAGVTPDCPGLAPQAILYIFRVYNNNQQSYTAWFLDALNYAMYLEIDIINMSIGGPDHNDIPFKEKINELSANGIIVVSAIGNYGPAWGSSTNPADMSDVIGVGDWQEDEKKSAFSSRGMTTWELPSGYGRVKPDLISPSVGLVSASFTPPFKCRGLSGTSVASPVISGAVALLLSAVQGTQRAAVHNSAAIKQILHASSRQLSTPSIFEQGAGLINVTAAYNALLSHVPHISLYPDRLSNFPSDCPYLWPWCTQLLFSTSQPILANITILNSMGVVGKIIRLEWEEVYQKSHTVDRSDMENPVPVPVVTYVNLEEDESLISDGVATLLLHGGVLTVKVQCNVLLWPWSGYLAVSVSVSSTQSDFVGTVQGVLRVTVDSSASGGGLQYEQRESSILDGRQSIGSAALTIDMEVSQPPERRRRVLWDVFHTMNYPSAYVPKDDLFAERSVDRVI